MPIQLPELAETIARGNCLGWFGAGVSAVAGLPTWPSLLLQLLDLDNYRKESCYTCGALQIVKASTAKTQTDPLIEYAASCIQKNQLKTAASAVRTVKGTFVDQRLTKIFDIEEEYKARRANDPVQERINRRLKCLRAIGWAGVVTTNYDCLLELGAGANAWYPIVNAVTDNLGRALRQPKTLKPFLVYLHGKVTKQHDNRLIFADEDYTEQYVSRPTVEYFLKALLLRHTVVFVGTQIDEEIVQLKLQLNAHIKTSSARAVVPEEIVILPADSHSRGTYLERTGCFKVVYYEKVDDHHSGLDQLLESAVSSAGQIPSTRDNDPDLTLITEILKAGPKDFNSLLSEFRSKLDETEATNIDNLTINFVYRLQYLCNLQRLIFNERAQTYRLPEA